MRSGLILLLAACTDTLVDPSVLQDRSPDGRDSLFATGNEEEQRLAEDIAYARSFGYVVKPLAIARAHDGSIEARVHPALVNTASMIAGCP